MSVPRYHLNCGSFSVSCSQARITKLVRAILYQNIDKLGQNVKEILYFIHNIVYYYIVGMNFGRFCYCAVIHSHIYTAKTLHQTKGFRKFSK